MSEDGPPRALLSTLPSSLRDSRAPRSSAAPIACYAYKTRDARYALRRPPPPSSPPAPPPHRMLVRLCWRRTAVMPYVSCGVAWSVRLK